MKFIALGGAREVGGSCSLLKISGKNILVDCGVRMNREDKKDSIPAIDKIDSLDLILLTHAHMDHSGALPVIHSRFPEVPIYCTNGTHRLIELLLSDAVKIMKSEQLENEGEIPLYDEALVEKTLDRVRIAPFSEWVNPPGFDNIKIYFHPAGHILGASSIFIGTPEGMIMFSGDISLTNQRTLNGMPHCPYRPDVVVMESTYGDRVHVRKRKDEEANLAGAVGKVIIEKGSVIIPAFAVGRAQEVLLILKNYQKNNLIPKFPVYVDGMVRSVCDIYGSMVFLLSPQLQRYLKNSRRPVFFDKEEGITKVMSQKMRDFLPGDKPCCIISSSGMLTGGPSPFYAKKLAEKKENAIFLTGYQDEESPGRKLLNLKEGDTLEMGDEKVPVKCRVAQYNLSAHADSNQINQIISYLNPRSVILVHGNSSSVDTLGGLLKKFNVWRPANNEEFDPLTLAPLSVYEKGPEPVIKPEFQSTFFEMKEEIQTVEPLSPDSEAFSPEDIPVIWKELQKFPLREYSIPELVRLWFGENFRKDQRKSLEQVLFDDTVYFEKSRAAKKWIYRPRSPEELEKVLDERIELKDVSPGSIILIKDDSSRLNLGIFLGLEETGEFFKAVIKGKKGEKRYIRSWFVQDIGSPVNLSEHDDPYWKVYLRNVEKGTYQYYKIISAAEAWKILYKEVRPYSFEDIVKMFFGPDYSLEQKMASAVRLNTNDIFFTRNGRGDYIPRGIETVAARLNKSVERLEKEMEMNSIPAGTVLKVKPVEENSEEPYDMVIFTGDTNAKGFECITLHGRKTLWYSKYIDSLDKIIHLEDRTEEELIKELVTSDDTEQKDLLF